MKKPIFILLLLMCNFLFAQVTEQQVLEEAKAQNINSRSDALAALQANGISESEARQLARQQGLDYDDFLASYFPNKTTAVSPSTADPDTSILIEETTITKVEPSTTAIAMEPKTQKIDTTYFGYKIFETNPFLEKEYLLGNINEDYLIAPGDKLRMIVFGTNSLELEATVDRNGNINIPNYGLFFAAGNTFKTLKSRLQTYLGKYFSGLLSQPQRTFLDVSLTQLSPTKVIVMGQVNAPGPHILTTQANPLAALYASGGVTTSGSLRTINIYRNNQLIHVVDLYDYITTGRLSKDIKLTNNDVVFVPPRLSSVRLNGAVKTAGIFELKPEEGLKELLTFSGGLPPTALTDKLNINTISASKDSDFNRSLKTINYEKALSLKQAVALQDGDEITFFSILEVIENKVTITGNVYQPGAYALDQYPTLQALILEAARGIKEDTYLTKVDVSGIVLPQGKETFASYNLAEVLSGALTVRLSDRDRIKIYSKAEVEGLQEVSITGFGIKGTISQPYFENQSVYDLIFKNASYENPEFETEVLESRLDLMRFNKTSGLYKTERYNLTDSEQLKKTMLKPYDKVVIYNKGVNERLNQSISVGGYVKSPTALPLQEQMYVEDAILLAGGFKDMADQDLVYINREDRDPSTAAISTAFSISIDQDYLLGKTNQPKHGFTLMDKDIITVRKQLGVEAATVITIKGEVNYPRNFIAEFEQLNFQELITAAGGLKPTALLSASTIVREGKVLAVDLTELPKNQQIFENGDVVTFAKNRGEVFVTGAVEQENYFVWEANKKAKYYLKNSGGKLKEADRSYLTLPNGKSKKINFFNNPIVLPDSKIVVNRKVKKERVRNGDGLSKVLSVATILTSLVTSVVLVSQIQ